MICLFPKLIKTNPLAVNSETLFMNKFIIQLHFWKYNHEQSIFNYSTESVAETIGKFRKFIDKRFTQSCLILLTFIVAHPDCQRWPCHPGCPDLCQSVRLI